MAQMGGGSLSRSLASGHHANKDYEMTITAMILVLFYLFYFLLPLFRTSSFEIPPCLLNYARRLLGQKRRVPLGRAELQVTNSLAYQFICATGVLALGSCKKTKREQEKKKKKKKEDAEPATKMRVDSAARHSEASLYEPSLFLFLGTHRPCYFCLSFLQSSFGIATDVFITCCTLIIFFFPPCIPT